MSGAALAHPEWLGPALGTVVVAGLALLAAWARARRRAARLVGDPGVGRGGRAPDLMLLVALALLGTALVGPRLGQRTELVRTAGVDVVLLLDVSRSMEARDVPPSRLARARRAAEGILAGLEVGDRAALAAFAGDGVLLTPLTPDVDALVEMLPAVDTELMQRGGSRLGAGVRAALEAFDASARPRVLVLLSDGEDPQRSRELGGAAAARAQVRVLAVAIGSDEGGMLPDDGKALRDAAGRLVVSGRDAERLGGLAGPTGGAVLVADRWGRIDLEAARAEIRRDAPRRAGEVVRRRVPAVRVAPFALAAFGLMGLELVGATRRARRRRRATWPLLFGALVALAPRAGGDATFPVEMRAAPPAGELLRRGVARAGRGEAEEARRALLAAALTAPDASLAAHAFYDLGVVALRLGKLEEARDAFLDALALAPEDFEARFNLEWTLAALAELRTPPPTSVPQPGAGADERTPAAGSGPERRTDEAASDATVPGPAQGEAQAAPGERGPAPLAPDEVSRWLDLVPDESSLGLGRAAAGDPASPGPRW